MRLSDYPCLADATSVGGLDRLAKDHPVKWPTWIWKARDRVQVEVAPTTRVGEALRRYGDLMLCPHLGESVTRLRHRREQARLVAECLGEVAISELGSDHLRLLEQWLTTTVRPHTGRVLGNERIKDVLAYARKFIPRLRQAASLPPVRMDVGPPPTHPRVVVPRRGSISAGDFALAFTGAAPKQVRVAIGLAGSANLWEREILHLRAGGLRRRREGFITYVTRRGHAARAYLPRFLLELVDDAFPGLDEMDDDALLFPRRGEPERPRSSLYREVALACQQAGIPPRTLGAFRLLYQHVARSRGIVSAIVRGTYTGSDAAEQVPGRRTTVLGECRDLALSWREPQRAPYGSLGSKRNVPRKRPKGVAPLESEIAGRGERRRPRKTTSRAITTAPAPSTSTIAAAPRTPPRQRKANGLVSVGTRGASNPRLPEPPKKGNRPGLGQVPTQATFAYAEDPPEPMRGPLSLPTIRVPGLLERTPQGSTPLPATDRPRARTTTSTGGKSQKAFPPATKQRG